MHLSDSMKQLMAYCYSHDNAIHYEYVFDKRDESFSVRFFINEVMYILITLKGDSDIASISEFAVSKAHYHPSTRVTHIGKLFKKYRDDLHYEIEVPIASVLKGLDTFKAEKISEFLYDIVNKGTYKEWRTVYRATGRF